MLGWRFGSWSRSGSQGCLSLASINSADRIDVPEVLPVRSQIIQTTSSTTPRLYHLDSLSFQPRKFSLLLLIYGPNTISLNCASIRTAKMSATVARNELIALYRSFLRELPARGLRSSPIQLRIREAIQTDKKTGMAKANEYLKYIKAQRMYATLLERYNPGMNMEEEERVKLTARRVGMELPLEYFKDGQKK